MQCIPARAKCDFQLDHCAVFERVSRVMCASHETISQPTVTSQLLRPIWLRNYAVPSAQDSRVNQRVLRHYLLQSISTTAAMYVSVRGTHCSLHPDRHANACAESLCTNMQAFVNAVRYHQSVIVFIHRGGT